jgi:hypothetical protein
VLHTLTASRDVIVVCVRRAARSAAIARLERDAAARQQQQQQQQQRADVKRRAQCRHVRIACACVSLIVTRTCRRRGSAQRGATGTPLNKSSEDSVKRPDVRARNNAPRDRRANELTSSQPAISVTPATSSATSSAAPKSKEPLIAHAPRSAAPTAAAVNATSPPPAPKDATPIVVRALTPQEMHERALSLIAECVSSHACVRDIARV